MLRDLRRRFRRAVGADDSRLVLEGHTGPVGGCAVAPDGAYVVSASWDGTLRLWDPATGDTLHTLQGHTGEVGGCAVAPDGAYVVSASWDGTLRLWDPATGDTLHTLSGHTGPVVGCAVAPDGAYLVSASDDQTLRLWDVPRLATPEVAAVRYTNAKVALVGDSGVGKTGLALVLSGREWVPTESTHGRHVWPLREERVPDAAGGEVTRETLMWDLAGQPGYRLIHQLSLTEVAVAMVVLDAGSETNPLGGVDHWARSLRVAEQAGPAGRPPVAKFLVEARADRGGAAIGPERLTRALQRYGFAGHFVTSAKESAGVAELREAVLAAIPWDRLPVTSSTELFQTIKSFLVAEKQRGRLLASTDALYRAFQADAATPDEVRRHDVWDEFRTCVGLVEGRGLIRRLRFGDLVLLQPEALDAYAAALVHAARDDPDGLAAIPEEDARTGNFPIPAGERIEDAEQGNLLLLAMAEDLLRHEIAIREGADLVFPSQFTRENPDLPDPEGKAAMLRFEGPVHNVYATLVVRLARSDLFTLAADDMWRNAAVFGSPSGGRFGLALGGDIDRGQAQVTLFYDSAAPNVLRAQFEHFTRAHIEARALPGTVTLRRILVCNDCQTPISQQVADRARERGKEAVACQVCDAQISLIEPAEAPTADQAEAVRAMGRQADAEREREAAVSVIAGKRATNDYDVFLCHKTEDKGQVKVIGERLMERELLPWLDEWELPPGQPWQRLLEEQIGQIKAAAVFVGASGIGPWQRNELDAFLREFADRDCPVIPVLLPDCPDEPELPIFLRGMTWVDFRTDEPDPVERLVWGVTGERPF